VHRAEIVTTAIIILALNFLLLVFLISVLFAVALAAVMEKNPPTEADLGSYEGRYPKDLFNKTVVADGQAIGRVAKETDDVIVIFGDSGNSRFDVPRSKIALAGGSVAVNGPLEQYAVDRDAPLPEGKSLRASAEEIRQKAGEMPEEPSLPVEEYRESAVEEKAGRVADEFKGVGRELEQAAKATKAKMEDLGSAAASDMESAARQAASGTKELARSGAKAAREKITAAQSNTEAGLSADSALKIDKNSKRPPTELDLASYEGKYPRDLFNKTVLVDGRPVGHVVRETDDMIVVFGENDSSTRFDIPKSEITLSGSSVVATEDLLFRHRMRRDAPMPAGKAMRPSGERIRAAAAEQIEVRKKRTTPDAVMEEGGYLATKPRPETTRVSVPEGYVDTESELSKKIKGALTELRELIVAGSKVAKKKVREKRAQAMEKQAEMDAETIARMGDLSTKFAGSFEEVLSEIRARTYADQDRIYTGFLKLMDTQRDLVVARRDLARRLKDSVDVPVVDKPRLGAPPELPEDIHESRAAGRTTKKRVARKTKAQ
jgi:gas vesicle protein